MIRSGLQRTAAQLALGLAGAFGAIGAAQAQEETPAPVQEQAADRPLPLWELRVGAAALYAPDYPASETSHWRGIGAPLFVYRGERLRIGGDEPNAAARAIAVDTKRFELSLSVDANYSADSEDNEARTGMPDLDTQLEIGPQLTVNLIDSGWNEDGRRRLRLLLPVREVGATDFKNYEDLGVLFQPTLTYRRQWPGDRRMSFSTSFAGTWATEGVQDYYYQVDAPYATADRPAYDAKGGYLGTHIQVSGVREVRPGLNVYLTYRLRNLSNAASDDSPLHRADTTQAFSVSVVWTGLRSRRAAANGER